MNTKQKLLKKVRGRRKEQAAKKTDRVTKSKVIREIIIHKDLKYLYPDDCTDPLARKEFRRKVRDEIRKLESNANQANGSARDKAVKLLAKTRKKYLAVPSMHV